MVVRLRLQRDDHQRRADVRNSATHDDIKLLAPARDQHHVGNTVERVKQLPV